MDNGTFIVVITISIIYFVYVLVDELIVGNEKTTSSSTVTIPVETSRFDVMKNISAFITTQNHYRIDYYNPENCHIVLNQGMSFQRFGFLYSIKITTAQEKSHVVIGISRKFPAVGPWAKRDEKMQLIGFSNAIMASLYSLSVRAG
jgi:hypothetical protein